MVTTVVPWAELVPDQREKVTAEELLRWSGEPGMPWKYELVAGRVFRMAPTGLEHGEVSGGLFADLRVFCKRHDLGLVLPPETGFLLSRPDEDDTVLAPDVALVSKAQVALLPPPGSRERRQFLRIAPELVVEVPSPDQFRPEMAAKALQYLAAGVKLVWIVWPGRREVAIWRPGATAPVRTLGAADTLSGEEIVPGFACRVADLFA